MCDNGIVSTLKKVPMSKVYMIGVDLAKNVFQVQGCDQAGSVLFRKKLRRDGVIAYLAKQPACTVAMEACSGSHYWGREISKPGHDVQLIPPAYVKPFVKRPYVRPCDLLL